MFILRKTVIFVKTYFRRRVFRFPITRDTLTKYLHSDTCPVKYILFSLSVLVFERINHLAQSAEEHIQYVNFNFAKKSQYP